MKPLCDLCGDRHESHQAHRFASNAASNKVTASNSASRKAGFPKEKADGRREGGVEGGNGVARESLSRPVEAVAQVAGEVASGVQRGLQHHGAQPVDVPAPAPGKGQQAHVEDDGLERRLDRGGRGKVKQRWSRDSYNAYQREYMTRRRAQPR